MTRSIIVLILSLTLAKSCFAQTDSVVLPKDTLSKELNLAPDVLGLDLKLKVPNDNPITKEKVQLGRRLFFDPILSKDNSVSCASCHQPEHGFASPDPKAIGIRGQIGKRNAPSVLNRAYGKQFFWDGRAESLEKQALMPITNPKEFDTTVEKVLAKIRSDATYAAAFQSAFAEENANIEDMITAENLAKALASFQRVLVIGDSPIDRFQSGDYQSITTNQRQGLWIFESRGGCWKCHSGDNYSDEQFHNTGVGFGQTDRDLGRFDFTKNENDIGKFKTPTLRGVAKSAPYMHDGSMKTLRDVVNFYNLGGNKSDPKIDAKIKPLGLTDSEIDSLVAFLEALSK